MSIEVRIPKEITAYKEKVLFGMSIRQLACFSAAIVLSVGTYLLLTKVLWLTMDTASYIIIIESVPLMAVGFITKNGFTFEKYAALFVRHQLGQQVRPYKTELDRLLTEKETLADENPEKGGKNVKSKYAWIFEKEGKGNGKSTLTKQERKEEARLRECEIFEVTKKERKRKRKEALRKIKTIRKECGTAKQRTAETA